MKKFFLLGLLVLLVTCTAFAQQGGSGIYVCHVKVVLIPEGSNPPQGYGEPIVLKFFALGAELSLNYWYEWSSFIGNNFFYVDEAQAPLFSLVDKIEVIKGSKKVILDPYTEPTTVVFTYQGSITNPPSWDKRLGD